MVQSCSIKQNCKSVWNPENKISFHRFPAEKKKLQQNGWKIFLKIYYHIQQSLLLFVVNISIVNVMKLIHFFRKKLLKDAVPTIFELNVNKENNDSQSIQIDDQKLLLHNNPSSVDALPLNEVSNIVIINESNPTMEKNQNFLESLKRNAMDLAVQVEDENFLQSPKAKKMKDIAIQVENRYLSQSSRTKQIMKKKILQQRLKRRDKSLASMKSLVEYLKKKCCSRTDTKGYLNRLHSV